MAVASIRWGGESTQGLTQSQGGQQQPLHTQGLEWGRDGEHSAPNTDAPSGALWFLNFLEWQPDWFCISRIWLRPCHSALASSRGKEGKTWLKRKDPLLPLPLQRVSPGRGRRCMRESKQ